MSLWTTVLRPAFLALGLEYIREKVLSSGRESRGVREPRTADCSTITETGCSCSGTGGSDGSRTDGCKADR